MKLSDLLSTYKRVSTAADAKLAIGSCLTDIGNAYSHAFDDQQRQLMKLRDPIQRWWAEVARVPDGSNYATQFAARVSLLRDAEEYIYQLSIINPAAGVISELQLGKPFVAAVAEEFGGYVRAAAETTGGVARDVTGGLLSGLGPVMVIVLAAVIFFSLRARTVIP